MESEKLIFITEDEENIRELLRCAVVSFGFEAAVFANAEELLEALKERVPALILLDIMLPGMDGLEALQRIRKSGKRIPVIFLTAKSTEPDKVRGLDGGADDYITKPFGILELSARIRAVLRRASETAAEAPSISAGDLLLDPHRHEVRAGGRSVELTLKEYELLKLLMESGGVIRREELLDRIWGYDFAGETRTLDMHIKTLRAKIHDDAEHPKYIKTVRGVGYKFIGSGG